MFRKYCNLVYFIITLTSQIINAEKENLLGNYRVKVSFNKSIYA